MVVNTRTTKHIWECIANIYWIDHGKRWEGGEIQVVLAWGHIFMLKNQPPFNGDGWIEATFLCCVQRKTIV
jgi:hypothetical protein